MQRSVVTGVSFALVFVVVICGNAVHSWPHGGSALYQCCCRDCKVQCFTCRNPNFTCNCLSCSCYASSQLQPELEDPQALFGMLLKSYSQQNRGSRVKWGQTREPTFLPQQQPQQQQDQQQQPQQQQQQHKNKHPNKHTKRERKMHRHGNGRSTSAEYQDANRTRKRLTPSVGPTDHKRNSDEVVT